MSATMQQEIHDALLSAHPWRFAVAKVELRPIGRATCGEYDSTFALPHDFLRAVSWQSALPAGLDYRMGAGVVHVRLGPPTITLRYIRRAPEAEWPQHFRIAVAARTRAEESWARADFDRADAALRSARAVDVTMGGEA